MTYPTDENTCAAAYVSTPLQTAIMIYPMTQMKSVKARPCGRPQVSSIFASGILLSPPMMLAIIPVAAVRLCRENELVTYGLRDRSTTSSIEAMKYISQILTKVRTEM